MSATSADEPTQPFPPRYWWLKRISLASVALLVLLTVLRLVWGWDANRRLQAEIAAIRASGEPIFVEEFQTPPVPDEENYVHYLRQAVAALNDQAIKDWALQFPSLGSDQFQTAQWRRENIGVITGNRASLSLMRTARQHPRIDWNTGKVRPVTSENLPEFPKHYYLRDVLTAAALNAHDDEDDHESLECIHDLLALSHADSGYPSLLAGLTAAQMEAGAVTTLQRIAPTLKIGGEGNPATRQQVESLLRDLIADDLWMQRALLAHRMATLDLARWSSKQSPMLAPMFTLDAARNLKLQSAELFALNQRNNAAAQQLLPARKTHEPGDYAHLISNNVDYAESKWISTYFELTFDRRAAAISVAMRLYQLDHVGQWPADLASLVPKYLPAVPSDPLSKTGAPIRLVVRQTGTRPDFYVFYIFGEGRIGNSATLPTTEPKDLPKANNSR